jgi:parvulin-like peptidyl-prolyl isomerase
VANAAYALEAVGDVAPAPVQTSAGWHLVQKTGFKRAPAEGLEVQLRRLVG